MSANAERKTARRPHQFGRALGLAFQVIDDILDVTQTSEKLGKSAGKDMAAQKATYPAVIGLEKSRAEAQRLTRTAHNALEVLRRKARVFARARELSAGARILMGSRASNEREIRIDFFCNARSKAAFAIAAVRQTQSSLRYRCRVRASR